MAFITQGDNIILCTAIVLSLLGLVMVYSASIFIAIDKNCTYWHYLQRQAIVVIVGFIALFLGMLIPVEFYKKYAGKLLLVLLFLMLVQTIFGQITRNTKRYVKIFEWTIQLSELARCAVIIYSARIYSNQPDLIEKIDLKFIVSLFPIAVMVALTYAQRDFSAAAMIAAIGGIILLLAGLSWKHFAILTSIALALATIFVLNSSYQRERVEKYIKSKFNTELAETINYQGKQSTYCFGCGGILGVGIGSGTRKMLFLPEPHTDFIFATIGEEMGLWGTLAIVLAFTIFMIRGMRILRNQLDRFSFLLGSGLLISILMFAFVHMGVTTDILPITGLPLPFISSGGSSLTITMWSTGVIWNLSRQTNGFM